MSEAQKSKNKGGRPPKDPGGGRSPTVTFRCRPTLQAALKAHAERSGHSFSEEIERRLDQSIISEDITVATVSAIRATVQKTATVAATEAALKLISTWAGDKKYFDIALTFATTLRHAMTTNGIGEIPISDIHNHPEEMEWIKNYIIKCMYNWFEQPGMSLDYEQLGRKIGENLLTGAYADEGIGVEKV